VEKLELRVATRRGSGGGGTEEEKRKSFHSKNHRYLKKVSDSKKIGGSPDQGKGEGRRRLERPLTEAKKKDSEGILDPKGGLMGVPIEENEEQDRERSERQGGTELIK